MSQTVLGQHLGISFQQIQKYENGTNRISSAALIQMAGLLGTSIGDFLPTQAKKGIRNKRISVVCFAKSSEGRNLINGFLAIQNPSLRRHIGELIHALGAQI